MKYIDIGLSGIQGSEIALGCMYMHERTVDEAAGIIQNAVEQGVNFFDHADIYGDGECERIFGQALKKTGVKREDIYLQSKCGITDPTYDFSKAHILESVDGSLQRLGTDYLDILLLHRPDALMEPEEIGEAFDLLQNSGKVRRFGVSNHHSMQVELLSAGINQRIVANQLRFSPVHTGMVDCGILVNMKAPGAEHRDGMILDYCRLNGITIQAWSPYQYGENDGVYLGNPEFAELNAAIDELAKEKGISNEAVVTAWILRHPARMQVLAGTMDTDRLARIAKASDHPLTREEWYKIYLAAGNTKP